MSTTSVRLLKMLGVAGVAGVTAGGIAVARDQRRRSRMEPDEVRERLRARLAETVAEPGPAAPGGVGGGS